MAFRLQQCTDAGARLLREGMSGAEARREARMLMQHVLQLTEYEFLKDPARPLLRYDFRRFASLIRRRAQGEPYAYLVGRREFYSVEFQVNPSVLIPRPETEDLIELIFRDYPQAPQRVLDVGTGSGCIAVILARQWTEAKVLAVDISVDALETARRNVMELGLEDRITLLRSDLLDEMIGPFGESIGLFDLIVSNPPYVLREEYVLLDRDVKDYEPETALVVEDPDTFYRRFFDQALPRLTGGGALYLESSDVLLPRLVGLAKESGFVDIRIEKDLSGKDRFLVAARP